MAKPRWLLLAPLVLLGAAIRVSATAATAEPATITFVANAENATKPRVRYIGPAWVADPGGFLSGSGRGHQLLSDVAPGPGDFRIDLELSLARVGRESEIVFGRDSAIVLSTGAGKGKLRGRFFRASDAPIEFPLPGAKAGESFDVTVQRTDTTVTISTRGQAVYRGPCSSGPVALLGLDPVTGTVRLYSLTVTGKFPAAAQPARPFDNPFGLQLRPVPTRMSDIGAPTILRGALTNESSIVRRRDGTLETYSVTKPASDSVTVLRTRDSGLTWTEPEVAFSLPGRAYYALQVLEAKDGALHAMVHVQGEGPGGYRGRLYEVYYTRRPAGASAWSVPRRVVPGYIGSIRGFIQCQRSGRLILAVARAIPAREQPPLTGPDLGWNDTFVYFSDDQGETWRQSPDILSLELKTANATRYGAIEPVLLELKDGRVWMLVRDRGGRLWQSISRDGERWPALVRSEFISSDSPAALLRLRDGKIILLTNACQNWSDPRSYAMGGREVLHAAISADEGRTWRGFREILHETNVLTGGDRGTAYPTLAESDAGKVVVASGQGEGKRAIVAFDPRWLEQRVVRDDLSAGPADWTQYGDEGLTVETMTEGERVAAIPLKSSGLCGAVWNFPLGSAGELRFRLQIPPSVRGIRLALTDHFSRVDDLQATEHAVFALEGTTLAPYADARWHDFRLGWKDANHEGTLALEVDGRVVATLPSRRSAQFGVNYLRIEFRASADEGRVLIGNLSAELP